MNKQLLTTAGAILAGILILGGVIWYYGNTRYEDGKSEVYLDIAQGKYDRNFTYYTPIPAPKPREQTVPGKPSRIDSTALDSLQRALKDSGAVIRSLAQEWTVTLKDSTTYKKDSLSVTFKGVHSFTVDPIRRILRDVFTPGVLDFPVRVEQRTILRDPTFWENLKMILYGTAIGALVVTLIHAL